MPLNALIVDDERLARTELRRLLAAHPDLNVTGEAATAAEAEDQLRGSDVDVLFLDIQMPGMTGFELLERLDRNPLVIFTTAYDRYALNAFDVNSIDYLLKPIDADRLNRALDKLVRVPVRDLARLLAAELAPNRKLERLASRVGERTTILEIARVTHFFAKDKLTFAVVNGRDHVIDYALADLESLLDARRFARIHRATIVNVPMIQELFPDVDGGMLVRLRDEKRTELSVARDRVRDLKQRLGI